jgi:hypothetical protein
LRLLVACLAAGCAPTEAFDAGAQLEPDPVPHFTLRGRLREPVRLHVDLDSSSSPIETGVFERAARWALDRWSKTGLVNYELGGKAADASATVVIAWHGEEDESCDSFLADSGIAHTGPFGSRTFVHLDTARRWHESEDRDHSLRQALLHELGHVLGLGHSIDPAAVMHPQPDARRSTLALSDRAGLSTLYGGMKSAPGDLLIERSGESTELCALRQVLLPDRTAWGVFDTDGDGADEILVWRTDPAGHGALQVFHFAAGPRPERTLGPLLGILPPGATPDFAVGPEGQRLLVVTLQDGRRQLREFDASGGLTLVESMDGLEAAAGEVDLDGDGSFERLRVR